MIRFALRLSLAGGRESAGRLAILAGAVALGVGMLLATLAGMNAVQAQNLRYGWLNTAIAPDSTQGSGDGLWWLLREDYYHGESIGRIDVASLGPGVPVPPGIPRLPADGEFYVSPALSELLRTAPPGELGDRFPGREAGVLGPAALPSPDSLIIIIGRDPATLERLGGQRVNQISTADPGACDGCVVGFNPDALTLVLSVVAVALLFPVLMFVGTATRLGAARREQRFAAMRLLGATPRQVSVFSAVESTVAAGAGTVAGFALFFASRPGLAAIPFTGDRFYPGDLSLGLADVLAVAFGLPLGAALAAWLALRRVRVSPLGVRQRVTPNRPSAWRLLPLAVGLAELTFFIGRRPQTSDEQILAYLTGIFLIMVGLVSAGPWIIMVVARLLAGRARRPATLIAGRRLADDPHAGFRSVSGLVVALFVSTVATGAITTYVVNRGQPPDNSIATTSLSKVFWPEEGPAPAADQVSAGLGLAAIPGVRSVTLVRQDPSGYRGLITCAELDRLEVFGSCPAGVQVASVHPDLVGPMAFSLTTSVVWDAADVPPAAVDERPVLSVVVDTTTRSAFERARTVLINAFPAGRFPASVGEWEAGSARQLTRFQRLADVVVVCSLPIAGCGLAVSVVAGLSDRRRPFSLLRLTGVQLATLRRVIVLETVVPLLAVAVVAIGMGLLAAHLFLRAQLEYTLLAPPVSYYLTVTGGLALSLAIVASTLPLLRRITGPESARNE